MSRPGSPNSNCDKTARSSFSSVRENDDGLAQTFTRSKVSSYTQGAEEVFDESPSVEISQPFFQAPLTQPHSRLHGFWFPADNFHGWKKIPIKGKAASRSCEDLHKLSMTWSSPAPPPPKRVSLNTYETGTSPLERLPSEVLGAIIDLLVIEIPPNGLTPRNGDLMALLMTSRSIHAATLNTLYRHITLPHSRIFRKFLATITEYPALASIVRRLDFSHFNPSTIFSTASERAQTRNLTSETLLQCLELTPYLQEFLAQEYIDEDLGPEVIKKLLFDMPRLQAIDFCGCSSSFFKNAFVNLVQAPWPETLSLTRVSFHKCLNLPGSVFEAILPRLERATHLDLAGTRVTDKALQSLPETARLTHLNLAKCRELSSEVVVKFITTHPSVIQTIVVLSLATNASSHLLLGKADVDAILPCLPPTIRSLSLKGSRMEPSHIPLLTPLVQHLEELAIGRGLDLRDIHQLLYQAQEWIPHTLQYLDVSDLDTIIGSASALLTPASAPLQVIELEERAYERAAKAKKNLERVGWTPKEFGSRYWLVRMNSDITSLDNGARWWKLGAESWGMRKIPVAEAEVGGMYGTFMFGRRLPWCINGITMAPKQDTPFRSADMSMVQLYVSNEIGREVVTALGELGLCQFRDLNENVSAFQRTFTQEIRRLDNVERQLRYFYAQMDKIGIPLRKLDLDVERLASPSTSEIDELSERSQKLEQRVSALNESYETLKKREGDLTEWRWVLREAGSFFDRAHGNVEEIRASTDNDDAPLLSDVEQNQGAAEAERSFSGMNIGFVAGVITRDRVGAFERILWRTLRGNLYMNQSEIPEPLINPTNNEAVNKNVFVIFAHGKEILAKIRKISESMGAEVYNVDENSDLRRDQIHEVNNRLEDVQNVLQNTQATLQAELNQISQSLSAWMVLVAKEKAVYSTLNNFSYDSARRTLIAEAWVPTNDLPLIRTTLQDVTNRAGLSVPSIINKIQTNKQPPTYLKTNKFTEGFQTIVNAYGTATYQEVNPAIPVFVTFPFLFAVMFGDFGHAIIMLSAALGMIYWEKSLKKVTFELFAMIFYGRYIALVMSVFSVFTGLIYNDAFSKSMTLFPSAWEYHKPDGYTNTTSITATLNEEGYRYPFGLDWAWHGSENDLLFSNSYKMKMSIILGWAHMTYSLCFSYINARHFKRPIDIWGNFIPGMIFFQAIFGYLVICIIYKWSVDWVGTERQPPGLLNMLIYMFLQPGFIDEQLYPGQSVVQIILLLLAFAQVPVLLFLKPLYLRWEHNRARAKGYRSIGETSRVSALDGDDDEGQGNGHGDSFDEDGEGVAMISQNIDEEHEEFEFSEVMIHQVIHTIEFCLNCVSHTASYLRLWALSLAHQQLSIVLWSMTLGPALTTPGVLGVIMIVVCFFMWFFLTIAILVCMEGTSAMLHSLRLAWVESFSKFAEFAGWAFAPFSFQILLEETEELKDYLG
ncbi:hypothetical protein FZEAL_10137 [Fusarium zealandicum]|uniref:V-type proton ATPase subunit a n=1 Tax=Fusarium zealandicum TaxID=1053134 RepID=A0A8H4U5E2_9HYPO|nr:hypothetical protein FZEAL_10137 [Fusarium zealandicum]